MKKITHPMLLSGLLILACVWSAPAQNQDAAALLAEVWNAHGVTASLLEAQVQMHGRFQRGLLPGRGQDDPLLIKQRGCDSVRFEIHGSGGNQVHAQHQGFRWSQKNNDPVRDDDGRYSLNLPFMDSPSTGLLAYLLANASRIIYSSTVQETFEERAVIRLTLKVPDTDRDRVRIGAALDRTFELIVERASRQVLLASLLAQLGANNGRDNYRYSEYLQEERVLFPGRVARSTGPLSGPFKVEPASTLVISKVQLNQKFKDDDFRRP